MTKQPLVLLYGGRSGEHEVSLRSASYVYANIDQKKYDISLIGISKEGEWFLQKEGTVPVEGVMPMEKDTSQRVSLIPGGGLSGPAGLPARPLVFPVLHGSFGEDGTLQGALETAGLAYVGADVLGCSLSMDKEMIKKVWQQEGLPVVPFKSLLKSRWKDPSFSLEAFVCEELESFGLPLFVKPANTGSSLGVSRVDSLAGLEPALGKAFLYDRKVLIEPCVVAREIECSVIGNNPVQSFPVGEVAASHEFYDYEAKYVDPDGAQLLIPAPLEPEIMDSIRRIAEKAFVTAGVTGFARVDFFFEPKTNKIMLNELNAIPGFTKISMFPMMCVDGGLASTELIEKLIQLGMERHREKENLSFTYSG